MQFIYIKPKEILTRLQLYSSCYNSFFFFLLNPYDKNFERSRKNKKKKKALITTVCPVSEKSSEYLLM